MPCTGRWKLSLPQPWARLRMLFHLPARLNRRLICFPLGLFDSPPQLGRRHKPRRRKITVLRECNRFRKEGLRSLSWHGK
jgi:hypothetical protein